MSLSSKQTPKTMSLLIEKPDGVTEYVVGIVNVNETPVFGALDLSLVMAVVDAANKAGFALVREQTFRDEWLICVFDAYEDQD